MNTITTYSVTKAKSRNRPQHFSFSHTSHPIHQQVLTFPPLRHILNMTLSLYSNHHYCSPSLIIFHLKYGKSHLIDLPASVLDLLRSIINTGASVIVLKMPDHITFQIKAIQQLPSLPGPMFKLLSVAARSYMVQPCLSLLSSSLPPSPCFSLPSAPLTRLFLSCRRLWY